MKLGEALQQLKTLQSKLARLQDLRFDTFNYLENKDIEIPFDEVTSQIRDLVEEIRILKVKINKTNALTQVTVMGEQITLQELILRIGDLRSELSSLMVLKPKGPVWLGGQAVEYIPQRRQDEMADIISVLEQQKADLDKLLQSTNWGTDLMD